MTAIGTVSSRLPPWLDRAGDLSDVLNPVLVKELRQGLKSRAFTGSFLTLQLLMVGSMGCQVAALHKAADGTWATVLFWICAGVPLLLLLPLLSINALHGEQRQQTLPLLLLTGLSPWRMVTGKWAALMAQSALIAVTVLPYVVLRYFLGGIHVTRDLLVLALLLSGSGLLCAGGLLLSTLKKPWHVVRYAAIALLVSPLAFGLALPIVLIYFATSARPDLLPVQLLLGAGILLHWAASRYATVAANQSTSSRAFAMMMIILLIGGVQVSAKFAPLYAGLPLLLAPTIWTVERAAALAWPNRPRQAGAAVLLGLLACLMTQPLPGPGRLYFLATLATACAAPAHIILLLKRWITAPMALYLLVTLLLLLAGGVLTAVCAPGLVSPPAFLLITPGASLVLVSLGQGDAALLPVQLGIAAASLYGLARWLYRRDAA